MTIDKDQFRLEAFLFQYPTAWPDGWSEDFAENKFFYLSGVRKALSEIGLRGARRHRSELKSLAKECCPLYPKEWVAIYPQDGLTDDGFLRGNHGVGELKSAIINDLTDHHLLTFSKAALCLCLLANLYRSCGRKPSVLEGLVQIRIANCYIPALSSALDKLSAEEIDNIAPVLGGTKSTLRELAEGFPVTRLYAEATMKELRATPSLSKHRAVRDQLKTLTYKTAEQVRKNVRSDGRSANGTIRAAQYEEDMFNTS